MIRCCSLYLPSRLAGLVVLDCVVIAGLSLGARPHAGLPAVLGLALWSAFSLLLLFFLFDLYDLDHVHRWRGAFRQSCRAIGAAVVFFVPFVLWMPHALRNVRELELDAVVLAGSIGIFRATSERMPGFLAPGTRVLLVGCDPIIQAIADVIRRHPSVPFRLRGVISTEASRAPADLVFAVCGQASDLHALVASLRADRVAVSAQAAASLEPSDLLELRRKGAHVEDALTLYESLTGRVPVAILNPRQIGYGRAFPQHRLVRAVTRCASALLAVLLLLLLAPLLLFLALAICVDSRGPVFYRQERIGLAGRRFFVLKFRSMRADAEELSGPVWASQRDPRVTRVGGILRKLRLDELPQLCNVLRGEMAFIGPRPERPNFVEMLAKHIPYYDLRHSIRPGITGWAQVCAGYGATVDESREKLEYDLFYLKNRSLALDTLILIKTIKIMLRGKGAR